FVVLAPTTPSTGPEPPAIVCWKAPRHRPRPSPSAAPIRGQSSAAWPRPAGPGTRTPAPAGRRNSSGRSPPATRRQLERGQHLAGELIEFLDDQILAVGAQHRRYAGFTGVGELVGAVADSALQHGNLGVQADFLDVVALGGDDVL